MRVLTGGTDVHLVLVDLRNSVLDGQQAEDLRQPFAEQDGVVAEGGGCDQQVAQQRGIHGQTCG